MNDDLEPLSDTALERAEVVIAEALREARESVQGDSFSSVEAILATYQKGAEHDH